MGPREVAEHLRAIANYIEREQDPRKDLVRNGISGVLTSMEDYQKRQAGQVTKFVGPDYAAADKGLGVLIERLSKAAETLNPQDDARGALEAAVDQFKGLRDSLKSGFDSLKSVEI